MMAVAEKPHLSQYEKVKAITEKLEQGIQNLFESENFKNYLITLISMFSPTITLH